MRVLVVEDEPLAAERLITLIEKFNPDYNVIERLDSVESTINWLVNNNAPDLIFLDIHLADGNSFEIFEATEVTTPIVFCTAYDKYAIDAFKVNSIDYLMKPVEQSELYRALIKFEKQQLAHNMSANISQLMQSFTKPYKSRFVVKIGEHIQAIEVENIHYFFSEDKATYLRTNEGKKCLVDFALDKVESMVDPKIFTRISRKYLVSFPAIKDILSHSNSRLRLVLAHSDDQDVIVARERVQAFRSWLDK